MKEKNAEQKQIINQLAEHFSLDSQAAKVYLVGVQSQFVLNKPRFKIILDIIIKENLASLPSMFRMAELVRQKWEKNPSKKYKISQDLSKPSPQPIKHDRYDLLLGTPTNFIESEERDRDRPKVVRRTKNDTERVLPSKLRHCPHGVPIGRLCAICEPDRFREATGEG